MVSENPQLDIVNFSILSLKISKPSLNISIFSFISFSFVIVVVVGVEVNL